MKVLIIGQGGREHAIAWKIAQSEQVHDVYVAPGNAGTALENKVTNIPIAVENGVALLDFAQKNQIDLTIVGPEAAIAAGVTDQFQAAGLLCCAPSLQAAQLEISKIFCKQFLQKYRIPTANYASFQDAEAALAYLKQQSIPIVIKADGLAAGKGVVVAETMEQAEDAIRSMLIAKNFGSAGEKIIIEEFLTGSELSFIALVDGKTILPLASSKDHKRLLDADQGPNTGGMGAYSPAQELTSELQKKIMQQIMEPTVAGLAAEGTPYLGFLYAGLMITPQGEPKVLEFNCRLGDPETQAILMRLKSDLVDLCLAATQGRLHEMQADWDPQHSLTIVMSSGGYPLSYQIGNPITGLNTATNELCKIFHAGTKQIDHQVVTNGGRVLTVTALGKDLAQARKNAYQLAQNISWPNCHFRSDIGLTDHFNLQNKK